MRVGRSQCGEQQVHTWFSIHYIFMSYRRSGFKHVSWINIFPFSKHVLFFNHFPWMNMFFHFQNTCWFSKHVFEIQYMIICSTMCLIFKHVSWINMFSLSKHVLVFKTGFRDPIHGRLFQKVFDFQTCFVNKHIFMIETCIISVNMFRDQTHNYCANECSNVKHASCL